MGYLFQIPHTAQRNQLHHLFDKWFIEHVGQRGWEKAWGNRIDGNLTRA